MYFTDDEYRFLENVFDNFNCPKGHPNYITDEDINNAKAILGVKCGMRTVPRADGKIRFRLSLPQTTYPVREALLIGKLRREGIIDILVNDEEPEPTQYRGSGTVFHYDSDMRKIDIHICRGEIKSLDITVKKQPAPVHTDVPVAMAGTR